MIRFPSAPVVAQWFSGFVVGVVLTLVASGVLAHTSKSQGPTTNLPPPRKVANADMVLRCKKIARLQLGSSYPNHGLPRIVTISLMRASPIPVPAEASSLGLDKERSLYLVFRLNDHPLGKVWRMRAARADIFGLMKAFYTSGLPIYNVELVGLFPLRQRGVMRESEAVIAYMSHDTAEGIAWKKWDRTDEGRLWAALTYKSVDPRFG